MPPSSAQVHTASPEFSFPAASEIGVASRRRGVGRSAFLGSSRPVGAAPTALLQKSDQGRANCVRSDTRGALTCVQNGAGCSRPLALLRCVLEKPESRLGEVT